jgi:DNA polymerase elongation subunit (family B)
LGAPGLAFNSPTHAAFVTQKGREILTHAMDWCREKGFLLVNADTDSIAFCKSDPSWVSPEERKSLLSELNALFPSRIHWEDDGYFDAVLVVKAKNYALKQGEKITLKGSALKATGKEPALRECIERVIQSILEGRPEQVESIRCDYTNEIENILDIHRWAAKKTITAKVLNPGRPHEQKILDALRGTEYQEGEKVYVYFTQSGALKLASQWSGDHCKVRLQKKLQASLNVVLGKKRKKR